MADTGLSAEKPAFELEQKIAPVTPPEDSTPIPNLDATATGLSKPVDNFPPLANGDSTAQPSYLGLHPELSNGTPSEPAAALITSMPSEKEADEVRVEKPVEHVAQGIQPTADFLPEQRESAYEVEVPDATATSTVPPPIGQPTSDVRDEPSLQPPVLDSGILPAKQEPLDSDVKPEIASQDAAVALPAADVPPVSEPAPVPEAGQAELNLGTVPAVPEPITESVAEPTVADNADGTQVADAALVDAPADVAPTAEAPATTEDTEMLDAPAAAPVPTSNGVVRPREEDEADEPAPKRTKTEEQPALDSAVEFKKPELPALSTDTVTVGGAPAQVDAPASATAPTTGNDSIDAGPITPEQKKYLVELLRRVKKTKDAGVFLAPVDPVALNLPTYFDIIKEPMDLNTIETKLKGGTYESVDALVRDINLMADNAKTFNGLQHPVTFAGENTRLYLLKSIRSQLPRRGATNAPASKPPKKESAPASRPALPRRESRTVARSPTGNARSPGAETYALQPDGTPLIRRDSNANDGRPKREIHRPQPKDLPYQTTRPKSKKHQTELKFCNHVMKELMKKDHAEYAWPFYDPVDPVALNIPSYHKVIKKPMDLGTVQSNLKNGQYSSGKEFKADTELIFANCFKFNPATDNVHQLGKKLESAFKELWSQKDEWIREHSTPDTRSDEEDEEDEDEEEEEEEEGTGNIDASRLAAIQAQINALSAEMTSLVSGATAGTRKSPTAKPAKKGKKAGDGAAPKKTKRSSSITAAAVPTSKPEKKKKPAKIPKLSQEQKREVSEGIGMLDDAGMRKAVQIIRNGVPSLQNVNDDELELDIDEIPDAVVYDLYKFVRSLRPKVSAAEHIPDDGEYAQEPDDDDFVPPARARGSTAGGAGPGRKKNKPMTATAQEAKIQELKDKLQAFQSQGPEAAAAAVQTGSASPDEDDDDDDAEGSSSEEE